MATAKQIEQPPPYREIVIGVTVIATVAAAILQWPSMIIAVIGLFIASALSRPPALTGPKDPSTQYPTVGNPGEQRSLDKHRLWKSIPRKLFSFGPFWPLTTNLVAAAGVGAMVYTLPFERSVNLLAFLDAEAALPVMPWLNALFAVIIVAGLGAAFRGKDPESGPIPPTDVISFVQQARPSNPKKFFGFVIAVSGAVLLGLGIPWLVNTADWYLIWPGAVAGAGAALIFFATVAHATMVDEVRKPWREMAEARATWAARWPSMPKLREFPQLVSHKRLGADQEVWIDEFVAPAMQGAKQWTDKPVPDGVEQLMPANTMVAFLSVPDVTGDGSPITLSRSATKFRVITWSGDHPLDITDPSVDRELLATWLDLKVSASAARAWGSEFSLIPLHEPEALHVEKDTWEGHETGAWKVEYGVTQGVNLTDSMTECVSSAQLALGHDIEVLPIGHSMYIGAIREDTTELKYPEILDQLAAEQEAAAWEKRWKDITGPGMQAPAYFPEHDAEVMLDRNTKIFSRMFGAPAGLSAKDYFLKATPDRLQSGLKGAAWSTACFYVDQRTKKRYPQLMQVVWSEQQISLNPTLISPSDSPRASQWALTGALNTAFLAAKMPRPEVMSVKALTDRKSRGHIWEVSLALHDGVTMADVRRNQSKLQAALEGCEWLRVGSSPRGARIMFGSAPTSRRTWANSDAEKSAQKLEWEQSFVDSKVKNSREETPELLDVHPLPKNDLVREYRFKMPAGLGIGDVQKERDKLMSTTGNGFLDIRQGITPAEMIIQAAEESPMPNLALFDWDEVNESKSVPFATNIQGEPMAWNPLVDPHVVLLGSSGSGKAQPMDTRIPVPVSSRFPDGWATNAELQGGDQVLTAAGGTANIIGFSPERSEPVYVFTLSDGQEVRSSGHHVWPVRNETDRDAANSWSSAPDTRSADTALTIRAAAALIAPGTGGTAQQIAKLAGVSVGTLQDSGVLFETLSRKVLEKSKRRATVYDMGSFLRGVKDACESFDGTYVLHNHVWTADQVDDLELDGAWLSVRSIVAVMTRTHAGEPAGNRDIYREVSRMLNLTQALSREGFERAPVLMYPVDEVLTLLAQTFEARAAGTYPRLARLMHAEDIAKSVLQGEDPRWSIDVPDAALATADLVLPENPHSFGAWIGDEPNGSGPRIPAQYLRASADQREELLRGISYSSNVSFNGKTCKIKLRNAGLAGDVLELVRSLGVQASAAGRSITGSEHLMSLATGRELPSEMPRAYIVGVRIEASEVQRCLRLDDPDHLYLTDGFVRTHNSAALQSFLTPAAVQGYEIHIFDKPKSAADFQYLVPYAKQVATEYVTIASALENVYKETVRRKDLNTKYGTSRVSNLPDEVRPPHMLVVIDEFTSTIKPELLDKVTGDETEDQLRERELNVRTNQHKGRIGAAVGKIMREARSAGVSMLVAGQTLSADEMKASPALGNIKNQAAMILLGKASYGQRASAFKNVELAPELGESVPKGRGIFESSEGAPEMFQAWYGANFADFETGPEAEAAHLELMTEKISAVRAPELGQKLDDDLRPDESEIRTFGEIIDHGAAQSIDSDEVFDLGEIDLDIDFGELDLDIDLEESIDPEPVVVPVTYEPEFAYEAASEPEPAPAPYEPAYEPEPAPAPYEPAYEPEPAPAPYEPEVAYEAAPAPVAPPTAYESAPVAPAPPELVAPRPPEMFQRAPLKRPQVMDDLF